MFTKRQIKSIRQLKSSEIKSKVIFLRADMNVPVKSGRVKDDFKIIAALPTIRYLLRYGAKLVIATHLGEPEKREAKYSTKPIAAYLNKLLKEKIVFVDACAGTPVETAIAKMKSGEIIFLQNLRFEKGEKTNDKIFAKMLVKSADIYVNDAFGVSHRSNASVSAVKKYLPVYAGLLLMEEIRSLEQVLKPAKPMIAILGGAKISTKIRLIDNLGKKAAYILIGGGLANNFFAAHGLNVGASLIDQESVKLAKKIISSRSKIKIVLPVDVLVGRKNSARAKPAVKKTNEISDSDVILDIGPETIRLYASLIKKARTIVWNGPLGYFEAEAFKHGTIAIARAIAARSKGQSFGVVGGGETVEALRLSGMADDVDWVSTGGGAMLSYLGGEKMPGIEGLS